MSKRSVKKKAWKKQKADMAAAEAARLEHEKRESLKKDLNEIAADLAP